MDAMKVIKLEKFFGIRQIFQDVSFSLKRGERLGLVGENGGGKSTLLKCILGEEEFDKGQVILPEGARLGYLAQDIQLGDKSLREEIDDVWRDVKLLEERWQSLTKEMESKLPTESELRRFSNLQERLEWLGGYDYDYQSKKIIYGLGFSEDDLDTPASMFSGGQKTRINLAKALVRCPDFLLLDEPTNHLDMAMLEWLENYLSSYGGGLLIVSHDRYFLDRVATGIIELERGKITNYRGNYSRYLIQKEANQKAAQKAFEKQQGYIQKTEAYIDKYRAGIKSKMARGRQSQLDRLERLASPEEIKTLDFSFPKAKIAADKILIMNDLRVNYGTDSVLKGIHLLLRRKDAVALIGNNGAGKTTLFKAIMGELSYEGQIDIGNRVQIGYFSQEHKELHEQWTALEEIMNDFNLSEEEARGALGKFLFRGDAAFRVVGDMSGGEKARLALLKLFLGGYNFLIMDEPTNHLDIPTREMVEQALLEFEGTYFVISHDRYFLDKITKRTVLLENGQVREYLGNYSYYKEKELEKATLQALAKEEEKKIADKFPQADKLSKKEVKDNDDFPEKSRSNVKKNSNSYMKEKRANELEMEIARLEATAKMYERQLEAIDVATAYEDYVTLAASLEAVQKELIKLYEKWEECLT